MHVSQTFMLYTLDSEARQVFLNETRKNGLQDVTLLEPPVTCSYAGKDTNCRQAGQPLNGALLGTSPGLQASSLIHRRLLLPA